MNNYQANARDQKRAENIRRQYVSREENKMEQLQKLDNRVKLPGKIAGSILGVVGALVMGAGMSMVMVWSNMTLGLALSIPGLAVLLLAFLVYNLITSSRKKKYAAEIMRLSNSVMQSKEENQNER